MFVYSFKASTIKFFGVIGLAIVTLLALVFLIPSNSSNTTKEISLMNENISFDNVKSAEGAKKFLEQYGVNVIRIPNNEIKQNFKGVCEYIDLCVKQSLHR